MTNLVQKSIDFGGKLSPLVLPSEYTDGSGLMNPSVFIDKDGDILLNLRHVNFTLYHSENDQNFISRWGPLSYIHPENYQKLATKNFICRLDKDLKIKDFCEVDTSEFDVEPLWEFVGLEDARLVYWNDKYYLIGVRRDTTTNGQGRMELSEIELDKENWTAKEIKRSRIPTPVDPNSYCEKNWVPVIDQDFHMIKWTSPTEVVKVDPDNLTCEQLVVNKSLSTINDLRGGSHVFSWGEFKVSITHEVNLFFNYLNQKDGLYRHRFVVWDSEWNLIGVSPEPISFLDAHIEFCAGASIYEDDLLVTFGFQDNAAFILKVPNKLVNELILEALSYGN